MSKQQAILETLLGAARLQGNHVIARKIYQDIDHIRQSRQLAGYHRLWSAAFETKREQRKAA